LSQVVRHLRGMVAPQETAGTLDAELLRRYVKERDEAAIETMMRRHGPMVLGVCRRVLGNPHDAEDAFQVTFLVLVRKASALQSPGTVGIGFMEWLIGRPWRLGKLPPNGARKKQRRFLGQIHRKTDPRSFGPCWIRS